MKNLKIITIAVVCFLMTGCFGRLTTYKEINYNKFNKMVDNKETFILLIGSSTCSHCLEYKPTLERIIKRYQVKVYYIDISKLSDNDNDSLSNKISFTGTPTVVFFKNGVEGDGKTSPEYTRIVGNKNYDYSVKKFKSNGFIK
jgi:predicted bacteriocin transport accessory protein